MNGERLQTILFVGFMVGVIGWRAWETFRKQGMARGQTRMMWSFYALFAVSTVVFVGTVGEYFWAGRPHWPVCLEAGAVLFVLANVMRVCAIRQLGRFWSLHIELRQEQPLIREGLYRWVRHPAYASFVVEHVAVPLAGCAWWSLGVTLAVYVPLLCWRIRREEAALAEKFGAPYRQYQREVGMLMPRWGSRAAQAR